MNQIQFYCLGELNGMIAHLQVLFHLMFYFGNVLNDARKHVWLWVEHRAV